MKSVEKFFLFYFTCTAGLTENEVQVTADVSESDPESTGQASTDLHEEADVIIIQQMVKASESGVKRINIGCEDTDVFVLLLHGRQFVPDLSSYNGRTRKDQVLNELL